MPVSKHRKKGKTARQHRKNRNIRLAEQRYIHSPKRMMERMNEIQEEMDQEDAV